MFRHIKVLSALLCLLLLYQNVNAKKCPAGQKNIYGTQKCVDCPKGEYNPIEKEGITCFKCCECGEGSETVSPCSKTSDTICRCTQGFRPVDIQKHTRCIREIGPALEDGGNKHIKCQDGFFLNKQSSTCHKWKECTLGILFPGNDTSDVVCKKALEVVTEVQTVMSSPTPITTSTPKFATSSTTASSSTINKTRIYRLWLVLVCSGILLLMVLLYCRCSTTRCILNHTKLISRKESTCRTPVEESGEKCHSLLV